MTLQIGQIAPEFTLPASNGENVSLSDFRGQKVVIFFYPKNMTPACTEEACDLRDRYEEMKALNTVILGISTDSIKSHLNFITKKQLPYLLLSDEQHEVCEQYGVWQLKKLYGKEYMGIVRSTFFIDEEGKLAQQWLKVRVKGHADAVLEAIQS